MNTFTIATLALALTGTALAQTAIAQTAAPAADAAAAPAETVAAAPSGDAAAGDAIFNKACVACHSVVDAAGETVAGRGSKTGPNLYAVANRVMGSVPDFRYSDSIVEAGAAGNTWTEEHFVGYVQDPSGYLKTLLDDKRARGKMMFQLRSETEAADVYAYLASLAPDAAAPTN